MILSIRKVFALLSACGLVASVTAYFGSWGVVTMESIVRWVIVLHIGIFVLLLPIYGLDYSASKNRSFFWKEFSQGMPKWVSPTMKLLAIFFAIHFLLFLIESHAASPQVTNGEYVLNSHGRVLQVITQREYLHLKGAELRLFATGWMFFYFALTMYWWFPRSRGRFSEEASFMARTS